MGIRCLLGMPGWDLLHTIKQLYLSSTLREYVSIHLQLSSPCHSKTTAHGLARVGSRKTQWELCVLLRPKEFSGEGSSACPVGPRDGKAAGSVINCVWNLHGTLRVQFCKVSSPVHHPQCHLKASRGELYPSFHRTAPLSSSSWLEPR